MRPFAKDEFGSGPQAPSEGHIDAVDRFVDSLRLKLVEAAHGVDAAAAAARREPSTARLPHTARTQAEGWQRVTYVEGVWDFYFDLFLSACPASASGYGRWTASPRTATRMSTSAWRRPPHARRLLPFSYADSGFSSSTYRGACRLRRLRHHPNLFPLIVRAARLDAVWALSSVLHEVSHNLQADLGLWEIMPAPLPAVHRRTACRRRWPSVGALAQGR